MFVLAGYRLDKLRMCVDVLDQTIGVFLHSEEVGIFLGLVHFAAADGAVFAVDDLGSRIESFTLSAVHSLVIAQVDVALVVQFLEDLLNLTLMVFIRRADKAVVGRVYQVPQSLDLSGHAVDEFLGSLARYRGSGLDLLAVLVTSRLEVDVVAVRSLVSGDTVRQDDLIGISDVRLA